MDKLEAALLAGLTATSGLGEQTPSWAVTGDARLGPIQLEGWGTPANKLETQDGWASRLGADVHAGPVSLGAHWSHRDTGQWDKDRIFARAGLQAKALRLLGEIALNSPNRETKLEARYRGKIGPLTVEPRLFWERFKRPSGDSDSGYGAEILLGKSR